MIRQLANELDSLELVNAEDNQLTGLIDRVGGIPLAIRLAVGRIATGLPLAVYLDKLDSGAAQNDLLQFCFAESWNSLNDDCKATLLAAQLFPEPPSEVELRQVTGIPEMRLSEAIGGLLKQAFLNSSYDSEGETYRYELLPLDCGLRATRIRTLPRVEIQIAGPIQQLPGRTRTIRGSTGPDITLGSQLSGNSRS